MKNLMLSLFVIAALLVSAYRSEAQYGIITTVAGNGTAGYSGDGGPAISAKLRTPEGIAIDVYGNLYIADYNNDRVRCVSTTNNITTIAGNGYGSPTLGNYSGDGGVAVSAELYWPFGVTIDSIENVYIADYYNNRVRKVSISGIITTFAGNGTSGFTGDGGPATAAELANPKGIVFDRGGNLYIADELNSVIRKVSSTGIITTIAGNGGSGYGGDGMAAIYAVLNHPAGIALDASGNLYIADEYNNRIRKVSASGIITTFAGNGTGGYSGDGGPAIVAELNGPTGVAVDAGGNVYIADYYNHRVRMVSLAGIITTAAGSGSGGYSGDGGPATAANMGASGIAVDTKGNVYISDGSAVVRKLLNAPTYISDSFNIYISNLCSGLQIGILPKNWTSGMYIVSKYGDSFFDSIALTTPYTTFIHNYAMNGTYTISNTLYRLGVPIDSFKYSYVFDHCNSVPLQLYYDANTDCAFDSGDTYFSLPATIEVDSNGVTVDTISTTAGLYYTAYGRPGDVYAFTVINRPAGMSVSCPISGVVYDTLNSGTVAPKPLQIGFRCAIGSNYDFSVNPFALWTGPNDHYGHVYLSNTTCYSPSSSLTVHYSHKCIFVPGTYTSYTTPTPTSYTDSTITWDFSGPLANDSLPIDVHYLIWANPAIGYMTIGDTTHTTFTINPTSGDLDPGNNTCTIIDTVKAGCDPNEMWVNPTCLPSGDTSRKLTYTISFMNTGNDTAHNIYVLDTLSSSLDPMSLRIVMSSNQMFVGKYRDSAGETIFKFDYPGINLLDSSYHALCDGGLVFSINTLPSLASGTLINNRAGIYFDDNPVVMTNTVRTQDGGCTTTGITGINKPHQPRLYPNPTTQTLIIETDNAPEFNTAVISNVLGKDVMTLTLSGTRTSIDVSSLPQGVYFVAMGTGNEHVVQMFVKM